jgi:hypothetical protein
VIAVVTRDGRALAVATAKVPAAESPTDRLGRELDKQAKA